jgi:hypothetical protein
MIKTLIALCVIGLFTQLTGEERTRKDKPGLLHNWEFSIGENYSRFISTPDPGHYGLNFGVYRNFHIFKRLNMKAGFTQSSISLQASNKTIRTWGEMGTKPFYLEHLNKIDFSCTYLFLNLFIDYVVFDYKCLSFHPLLGLGYSIATSDVHRKDIEYIEESWTTVFPEADYDQYDDLLLYNDVGTVLHYGAIFKYKKLFIEFYSSNHRYTITRGGPNLEINERMENFNMSVGYVF